MYIINAQVRRDAHTTTPVSVRVHEIAILQTLFGPENVHTLDGKLLDAKTLTADDIGGSTPSSESEFERLAAKYGENDKGPYVEQVYGPQASGNLDAAIERLEAAVDKLVSAAEPAATKQTRGRKPAAEPAATTPAAPAPAADTQQDA